jgi:hypothetical protein
LLGPDSWDADCLSIMPMSKPFTLPGNVKMEKEFRGLIAGSNRDVHNNVNASVYYLDARNQY